PDMNMPIATISDIGQVEANKSIALDGRTAFDPKNPGGTLTYNWNFGDGTTASGIAVNHMYTTTGNYTLSLTVSSATGIRQITKSITVVPHSTVYDNPYSKYGQPSGVPRANPSVTLPTPNDGPIVQSHLPGSAQSSTSSSSNMALELLIGLGIVLVIVLVTIFGVGRKKQ
ncbi:MAG: PKD domain-containing protein, partial [Chloroflexota bacterium]|nr:PKD domain-containing protein [Chloroflexota bacterium]